MTNILKTIVPALPNIVKKYGERSKVSLQTPEVSRTHQSMLPECDINSIVKKANSTGQLPQLIKSNPQYGDFTGPIDYHTSMTIIAHANEQFAALPAHQRARFSNDPIKFLEFTANPENLPEMVKLGLATKRELPQTNAKQDESKLPTIPVQNPGSAPQ
jgi:phage internal scaffolding protein